MSEKTPHRNPYTNKKINLHGPTHKDLYKKNLMTKEGRLTPEGRKVKAEYDSKGRESQRVIRRSPSRTPLETPMKAVSPKSLNQVPLLPTDALYVIMLNSKLEDLKRECEVNKQWNRICKSWKFLLDYATKHWKEVDFPFFLHLIKTKSSDPSQQEEIYKIAYKIVVNLARQGKIPSRYNYLSLLKTSIDFKDYNSFTALIWAAANGYADVVAMLIANGANLEARDKWGRTALILAAANGYAAIVAMLIAKEADIEAQDKWGRTALICVAEKGYSDIVAMLIASGANIEAQDNDDYTPLIWAAANGYADIVAMLIAKKANLEAQDNDGRTALIWAAAKGYADIVSMLIAKEANIEAQDNENRTPLIWALRTDNTEIVKILLEKGANVNDINRNK
jgi:ankyrin repeat protein